MLSDILPIGYHGTELVQVGIGESVVIWGAGPVGLMAAMSARLWGAEQVLVVDRLADRLKLVQVLDATPTNESRRRRAAGLDATCGEGADEGVEAVGYQAHGTRATRGRDCPVDSPFRLSGRPVTDRSLGVVGVRARGLQGEDFEGRAMISGQCNTKQYNRQLRN